MEEFAGKEMSEKRGPGKLDTLAIRVVFQSLHLPEASPVPHKNEFLAGLFRQTRIVVPISIVLWGGLLTGLVSQCPDTQTLIRGDGRADCGPRSLQIVLEHFGRHIPLEQLMTDSGTTAKGTTMLGLKRCAQKHGLHAEGFLFQSVQLAQIPVPAIVFLDGQHFAVLVEAGPAQVLLHDPRDGPAHIGCRLFLRRWKGHTVIFKPQERSRL